MTAVSVSVIIVSRGRPQALLRCLTGIAQIFYENFEVVVVADPAGCGAVKASVFGASVKLIEFDQPNISAARNQAIAVAAGDIVAFIDDDAVPEPTWLDYLTGPFAEPDVVAACGFVRGRNGISFQSRAQSVDHLARHWPIETDGKTALTLQGEPGRAIKTEGTNCAFRRDVLADMGGFDPAFRFYLDETDLNLRLAAAGAKTALVPLAQVHHGFAASAQRHGSRMPRTLFDVGASLLVFLRKHARPEDFEPVLQDMRREQKARLLRHLTAGNCEPRDIAPVMRSLDVGFAAGRIRPIPELPSIAAPDNRFRQYEPRISGTVAAWMAGRSWQRSRLRRAAAARAAAGERVSLFLLSPTTLYHHVRFDPRGFWEQSGGIFGKSTRDDPVFKPTGFRAQLQWEIARVAKVRGLTG